MNDQIMWQPGMTLADVEKKVILKAYSNFQRNKTQTARALDISIRTLDHKLEQYAQEELNASSHERGIPGTLPKIETGLKASTGVSVQPPTQHSEEQSVSMREQGKIQKMPPTKTSTNRAVAR